MYNGSVLAILNAADRKGPIRIVFEKAYDIEIYISDKS